MKAHVNIVIRIKIYTQPCLQSLLTRCVASGGRGRGRKPQDIRHVQEAKPVPEPLSLNLPPHPAPVGPHSSTTSVRPRTALYSYINHFEMTFSYIRFLILFHIIYFTLKIAISLIFIGDKILSSIQCQRTIIY